MSISTLCSGIIIISLLLCVDHPHVSIILTHVIHTPLLRSEGGKQLYEHHSAFDNQKNMKILLVARNDYSYTYNFEHCMYLLNFNPLQVHTL